MQETQQQHALTFVESDGPNVVALKSAYDRTTTELGTYFNQCVNSSDERRCYWPGKSSDLRKHGGDAFPWEGASDTEARVIDEKISTYVSIFTSALAKANIRAYPVEQGDTGRSRVTSAFLKWMLSSYIPRFREEMELGGNYLLERGLMITYVGWERVEKKFLQKIDLQQIAATSPELAQLIIEGKNDKEVIDMLRTVYPDVVDSRAKKALVELRKKGVSELPISRLSIDRPYVQACAPDGDVFFPSYCLDPQRAPFVFYRTFLTVQEVLSCVTSDGWDEDWAEYVVSHFRGVNTYNMESVYGTRSTGLSKYRQQYNADELIEIVYAFQRLIDPEDGSEGIYRTIMHPKFTGEADVQAYAKFELLNGYNDYPFVVTRLSNDSKRMYDIQTFPELLRGYQDSVKTERDSRTDRNSLATLPPIMHPVGNPPADWGPGRYVPYRRAGEFSFGPVPQYNPGSVEMERTMLTAANDLVGLNPENPLTSIRQQFFVSKFLNHARDVLKMAFKCYQRFGPDEVFFRVTGVADPMRFNKGNPDEDFDVTVSFDILNNDPDTQEARMQQFVSLLQLDKNGRINADALLESMAASIDPVMADAILQPAEQAQQQVVKLITEDLSKIYAGIEVGARPNGAQIAMQVLQQYTQQPDVAQRLQQDESFKARLEKYATQYQFALQQMQNAQIGKLGTAPAQMGDVNTQGMQTL
jgi:hypothetical protein